MHRTPSPGNTTKLARVHDVPLVPRSSGTHGKEASEGEDELHTAWLVHEICVALLPEREHLAAERRIGVLEHLGSSLESGRLAYNIRFLVLVCGIDCNKNKVHLAVGENCGGVGGVGGVAGEGASRCRRLGDDSLVLLDGGHRLVLLDGGNDCGKNRLLLDGGSG